MLGNIHILHNLVMQFALLDYRHRIPAQTTDCIHLQKEIIRKTLLLL